MTRRDIDYFFKRVAAVAAGILLFCNLGAVAGFAGRVLSAAAPLFYGVFIAYMVDAPAAVIQKRIFGKRVFFSLPSRTKTVLSMLLAYLLFFMLIGFLIFVFVPGLIKSLYAFALTVPEKLEQLTVAGTGEGKRELLAFAGELANAALAAVQSRLSEIGAGAADVIGSIWNTVYCVFFGFVFSVYILMSRKRLKTLGSKLLMLVFKEPLRTAVARLFSKFHLTFRRFVFGQMTDSLILGSLCFLGMVVLGLPFAAGISLVVAVSSLIPVAGAFIGVGISALVLLASNPLDSLVFVIFILILQQLENNLIYPKVVGDALGIDGMFVFAGVVVGAGLWGVKGMILGVPVTAFLYSLLSDFSGIRARRSSEDLFDR